MHRIFFSVFFLSLIASPAWAEGPDRGQLPPPAVPSQWTAPATQHWSMNNGIEVWLVEAHHAPLISMRIVTAQGGATDPAGMAGLASLMVDMLDEGAGAYDALALSDAFQLLATDYNAEADIDGLVFGLEMLGDNLQPSLALLRHVISSPTFPQHEFDRLKNQRLAEALADEAELSSAASRLRKRVLFGSGYGGFPASGIRDTLATLTLDNVKAQYKKLVQPHGAKIVVVGDITRDTLSAALEQTFGTWQGKPTGEENTPQKQKGLSAIHLVDFPGSAQSVVMMARPAPPHGAEDHFQALVFNRPFGGSFTGRVNMNLREDKGYSYGARGVFTRNRRNGAFVLYAKVKGDTTRASIDEMILELRDIRGPRPLTAKEVEDAKGGLQKSFPGRFERMGSVANQLRDLALGGYGPNWFQRWSAQVGGVDLSGAQKAAVHYTNLEDFAIIVAGDRAKIEESLKTLNRKILLYDTQGNPKLEKTAEKSAP